ncbi:MAG: tRNA (N6-threonylcarbamoyladenosine(37)-N6)-methyltransferase TrmO [Candidatus Hermodarchaeota archaeon]
MEMYKVYPIGFVRKEKNEEYLDILSDYSLGLYRLETISHVFVIWWIHENDTSEARNVRKTIPRVTNALYPPEKMGTFATRSPRRPNPLGMTLVKIMEVVEHRVYVDHIDAIDGTPVLDIKPYLPNGDRVEEGIYLPPWFQHLLTSRPTKMKKSER